MKPLFYLSILITAFGLKSYAQQDSEPLFGHDSEKIFFGGIVVGLNTAQVDGDGFAGFHKAGLNIGGMVIWRFSKLIGLGVEMLYSQKGSRAVQNLYDPYGGGFGKYKIDLNYAEVPVLLYLFANPKYQFGVGASYNGLISSNEIIIPNYNHQTVNQDNYPFNKSTFDIIGSVSVTWKNFMLSGRYQYGLTPVRNWNNLQGVGSGDQYNNMFAFRLAYLF